MRKKTTAPITLDPFQAWAHRWGRLGTVIALIYMIALPFVVLNYYDCIPTLGQVFNIATFGILAIYIPVGLSEAISYSPLMGASSYLGFILGTGTNTAYVEKNANIAKLPGLDAAGTMIINAESGGFNKLARSTFDEAADQKTGNPGFNFLEKMIAGGYLGGVGLEIYKAAAKAGMFSAKAAQVIGGLGSLETMDFDNFCASFRKEGRDNPLDAIFADADDAKMARRLGIPVFERAAVLTAIHLAAFCIKSGEGAEASAPIAINADGSTYYKTRAIPFAETVKRELDDMLVRRRNIHYCITPQVEDAPMVGAAIAAML